MSDLLLSRKLFRLLGPVLGVAGLPIRKLVVTLDVGSPVVIELTEYIDMKGGDISLSKGEIAMPPSTPLFRHGWEVVNERDALLDKLIAVVEGRDDQTQTR